MAPGDLLEKGHFGLGMAFLVALAGPLAATSIWGLAHKYLNAVFQARVMLEIAKIGKM